MKTKKDIAGLERLQVYRRGWVDAAKSRMPDSALASHPTRVDLAKAYSNGWHDGRDALNAATAKAIKKYKANVSPLR